MKKIYTVKRDQLKRVQISEPGEYTVRLAEPGAQAHISGAFSVQKRDRADVTVIVHHMASHTRAETMLKGVADDSASVRFVGRIVIDENCGDSNSFLTERVLLLSDEARAEALPELEILSDDVKCSHAASVTKIPEEQLFYLMSRGLERKKAEEMIVAGFLEVE